MIGVEQVGSVAVVRLSNGKVNALDVDTLDELTARMADIAGDAAVRSVVITGEGRAFSAGVDLFRYLDGGPEYVARLVPALAAAFTAVFELPVPTVAAVNGAAIAGGCILACACDRRLVAAGARVGATELSVGVALPVAGLEIIRYACGDHAGDVIMGAGLYEGDGAVGVGLAHEVVAPAALLDRALEVGAELGARSPAAFRHAKALLHRPVRERIAAAEAEFEPEAVRVWTSPEALASVRASLERTTQR